MTALSDAAVAYARAGVRVFPVRPREKTPYGRTPGLHGASADADTVAAWWAGRTALPLKPIEELRAASRKAGRNETDAQLLKPVFAGGFSNVGLAVGAVSGFWVLDIDGPAGAEALAALEAQHGPLPTTPVQSTGKGAHYCFAWPVLGEGRELKNSASRIGEGIDVRAEGGYIVAAPSIHPSGRVYAWRDGLALGDIPLAAAPVWLLDLAVTEPKARPVAPMAPRTRIEGRATAYGEAGLTAACRLIATAPEGRKNDTLWNQAIAIGQLVAGGEIAEQAYALDALREAGRAMCHWSPREEDTLTRGFEIGLAEPRQASRERRAGPTRPHSAKGVRQAAQRGLDVAAYWSEAGSADVLPVRCWLEGLGLDPDALPGALRRFRLHPEAPDQDGELRPMLLCPISADGTGPVDAVAMFDVESRSTRPAGFMGAVLTGRALVMTDLGGSGPVVVGLDFADAWVMGAKVHRAEAPARVVACLTVSAFSGGVMQDRFGRVDPFSPIADPSAPPWRLPVACLTPGETEVGFAVRRDLVSGAMRFRAAMGGTAETRLRGDMAAAYFTGLTVQAWERLPLPEGVRLRLWPMTPEVGVSFHEQHLRAAETAPTQRRA